jgi:hypothetical protein
MTPPDIVIVVLSGFTAPKAELVAAGMSAATMARGAAVPELPLGVATIRLAAPVGGRALIAPLPLTDVVVPSPFTMPSNELLAVGSSAGTSVVEGLALSWVAICEDVAFCAADTLVL